MRVLLERGMPDAEHGVAADRFAREIARFLKALPGALAAAERQTVGRLPISAHINRCCTCDGLEYKI